MPQIPAVWAGKSVFLTEFSFLFVTWRILSKSSVFVEEYFRVFESGHSVPGQLNLLAFFISWRDFLG